MLYNQSNFCRSEESLVIGQFSFSLFFIGHHMGSKSTERNETGLITVPDQTERAVQSCNG